MAKTKKEIRRPGGRLGIPWRSMKVGDEILYKGSHGGCRVNTNRANHRQPDKHFISFKAKGGIYVMRTI